MITLEADRLHFRFPGVHARAHASIMFQRTLRIPDDKASHPLPPGLGHFPLRHVDDYGSRLPAEWLRRGGVLMPMHQAEAMWIRFNVRSTAPAFPFAVKVATGKICAVSGEMWTEHLNRDPQDYVVIPHQPWIDGYCVEKGLIRQFVAMPLGDGYTVEEQLTGMAEHGGIQLVVYPMKAQSYKALLAEQEALLAEFASAFPTTLREGFAFSSGAQVMSSTIRYQRRGMGLAPGGRMRQEIYDDPHGLDAWDQRNPRRCFVTIANSEQWMEMTGERPPTEPPTSAQYASAGLPWFDYYDADAKAVAGADKLKDVSSVAEVGATKGETPLPENESVTDRRVVTLAPSGPQQVREPGSASPPAPANEL